MVAASNHVLRLGRLSDLRFTEFHPHCLASLLTAPSEPLILLVTISLIPLKRCCADIFGMPQVKKHMDTAHQDCAAGTASHNVLTTSCPLPSLDRCCADIFGMPELKKHMDQQFNQLKDMMSGIGKLFGAKK